MRALKHAFLVQILVFLILPVSYRTEPDVNVLVSESVAKNEQNWKVAPQYSFTEDDVVTEKGKRSERRYQVLMIEGSHYNRLVAENGGPLPPDRAAAEEEKMKAELERRKQESSSARQRRIAKYERDRHQEQALMQEMAKAFTFQLVGEETLNGHNCYVLEASPRPDYQPSSNETKVLTGMRGTLWIDTQQHQWVKVQAQVYRPVAFGLFLAHVQPGTEFVFEQAPVDQDVWLPSRLTVKVHATALVVWSKNYIQDERYSNYQLMEVSAKLPS